MSKKVRLVCIIICIVIALSAVLAVFKDNFFISLIDNVFLFGLVLTIIGGFLSIKERGFYRITSYPFKKVKWFFSRPSIGYDEDELKKDEGKAITFNEYISEEITRHPSTQPILISGLILFILPFIIIILLM